MRLPVELAVAILLSASGFISSTAPALAIAGTTGTEPAEDAVHLVGHLPLDPAFNHGVTVHRGIAYVGSFQSSPSCPSRGVKAVDVTDPAHPRLLGTIGAHPYTNNEQTRVISAHTSRFRGDLLVTTLENCWWFGDGTTGVGAAGLEFWDVTKPLAPVRLGLFVSKNVAFGYGDVALIQRGAHIYAVGASSFSEVNTGLCDGLNCGLGPYRHNGVEGDVIIVDATDPAHPAKVGDWGAGKDGGLPFGFGFSPLPAPAGCQPPPGQPPLCRGRDASAWAHTVSVNRQGTHAYVGYRDDGLLILDISNPAHPRLVAQTPQDVNDEGNTHLGVATAHERITVASTEIYAPLAGGSAWGNAQLFDTSDLRHPVQVGTFATAHSKGPELPAGCDGTTFGVTTYCGYSAHQQLISGRTAYFAWYNDGLRVVDISRPSAPREVAHYAPPGVDYIWIAKVGNLVFAADVNRGLDVLRVPLDESGEG
ncbi:MAG: hypothetical protein DLM67_23320 [Candidatus Nephthysia bennettiae]|uniref:Choice-of-anchor B family protein n=1 Tax=Candidatus Nephthysia bennettiae TaxID=3127016 RepID=A0A934K472_9BACT|nr:hypothetical protein [Candidatus Dormibacteraeota bacterium]MBJ7612645.1 hypothetical protein [Candidatus Dormibacteraeota bacterium]PZR86831.1 MAG: hypothetical protein DLM67_23320 [Candidatus Dormibacteraeota bacterium]